ncbi:MAG TPA: hypothetical protein VGE13_01345 [Candidatus Saccharimonadales bacterium]
MNATEILVIILSIFLAVFLLMGIALTVLLIKVTLQIRRVTTKAENAANNIEAMTQNVSNVATGAAIGRFVLKGVKSMGRKRKGKKYEE